MLFICNVFILLYTLDPPTFNVIRDKVFENCKYISCVMMIFNLYAHTVVGTPAIQIFMATNLIE